MLLISLPVFSSALVPQVSLQMLLDVIPLTEGLQRRFLLLTWGRKDKGVSPNETRLIADYVVREAAYWCSFEVLVIVY